MDGFKKTLVFFALMVLVTALAAPALAQSYGSGMAQQPNVYQGGMQPAGQGQMGQGQMGQAQQGQQGGLRASNKDLTATMDDMTDISMFAAAVKAAGYDKTLSENEGPYMVFAPSDKAIQKNLGVSDADTLVSDQKTVKGLVDNCIVSKVTEPKQGTDTMTLTSIGGKKIVAKKTSSGITVNGMKVVNVMKAENGMVIVTDGIVGM
jgi:uncharacterized surface protein with fasciclin (FAS1) repeats